MFSHSEAIIIFNSTFQSGSQNDLIDSWRNDTEEDSTSTSDAVSAANARWMIGNQTRNLSAEYPFHKNLCMPPQGINFDLTHKRGMYRRNVFDIKEIYRPTNAAILDYTCFMDLGL